MSDPSRPTFDAGFSTEGLSAVYTADSTVAAILEFEAALALALADVGIAPRLEAEQVAAACRRAVADPEMVLASTWGDGTPIISLRERIVAEVGDQVGRWFHHGATTQDAVDSGQMIQARTAIGLIQQGLKTMGLRLRELTIEFRDQPHMGRTFLQDARPTTFGFRTATWLDAVAGHIDDLGRERDSLCVQLGGPVGTGAEYGDAAAAVTEALAERLHLRAPDISWHVNRSRILSMGQAVERLAVTMGKIGWDVALLASTSISEISVRSGGSSSMPGKENPVDAIRAVATASACTGALSMLSAAPPHQLDRAVGSWHVEWLALPLVLQTAGAAVESIGSCLDSLEVDREAMTAHAGPEIVDGITSRIDSVLTSAEELLG